LRVGDVGLGTGTLAAYVTKGDFLTFYEINPDVVDLATSGQWFTYVSDARVRGAKCDIKLGDARLTLAREVQTPNLPRYHVLVLDAFSGDAVPTHLLTIEAYASYLPRLARADIDGAEGALVVHTSNRYLDLSRVVSAAADKLGLTYLEIQSQSNSERLINKADWAILTRNEALLAALRPFEYRPETPPKPLVLWTDARSSLFEIVR
jgi:spermidine synthase